MIRIRTKPAPGQACPQKPCRRVAVAFCVSIYRYVDGPCAHDRWPVTANRVGLPVAYVKQHNSGARSLSTYLLTFSTSGYLPLRRRTKFVANGTDAGAVCWNPTTPSCPADVVPLEMGQAGF